MSKDTLEIMRGLMPELWMMRLMIREKEKEKEKCIMSKFIEFTNAAALKGEYSERIIKNNNAVFKFEYDNHVATLKLIDCNEDYYSVLISKSDARLMKVGDEIKLQSTSSLSQEWFLIQKEST